MTPITQVPFTLLNRFRCFFAAQNKEMTRYYWVNGHSIKLTDFANSHAADAVMDELRADSYGIRKIPFQQDDVIIDIGGHIGGFAIVLAKMFPSLKIFSFEPLPYNFEHLRHNLAMNNVRNVEPIPYAVTSDAKDLDLVVHLSNTGGATAQLGNPNLPNHEHFRVPSVTLDDFFTKKGISRCRLLKIDCEGGEHSILHATNMLPRIHYLSGEFHINNSLLSKGYTIESLMDRVTQYIPKDLIKVTTCRMAE